jgi:hypothetical protein
MGSAIVLGFGLCLGVVLALLFLRVLPVLLVALFGLVCVGLLLGLLLLPVLLLGHTGWWLTLFLAVAFGGEWYGWERLAWLNPRIEPCVWWVRLTKKEGR